MKTQRDAKERRTGHKTDSGEMTDSTKETQKDKTQITENECSNPNIAYN